MLITVMFTQSQDCRHCQKNLTFHYLSQFSSHRSKLLLVFTSNGHTFFFFYRSNQSQIMGGFWAWGPLLSQLQYILNK